MGYDYRKYLSKNSKELRINMTKTERHLWYDFLKDLPVMVCRQKMIGNYIVDFYCSKFNVIIEIDGCQHGWDDRAEKDIVRDKYLDDLGMTVLRYSNEQVNKQFKNVCADILKYIKVYD
jgi:very-short-patch-repair endonuclease